MDGRIISGWTRIYPHYQDMVQTVANIVGEYGKITEASVYDYGYAVVKGKTETGESVTLTLDVTEEAEE